MMAENKKAAPLTAQQIDARIKLAEKYLVKRFPDLAFCLLVAKPSVPGTQNIHSSFNVHPVSLRAMLRGFALHHEKMEKAMSQPGGVA